LQSLFGMMSIDLAAPDHTTLSRRGQVLDVSLRRVPTGGGIHLIVASSGLSILGEGEWATAKHGVRGTRGWKKLHLAVDRSGVIIEALTEGHVDDATTALHLIDAVDSDIASVTADGAYDSIAIYDAAGARGASVVVPPTKTTRVSRRRPRSTARDRTIKKVRAIGRPPVEEGVWLPSAGPHRRKDMGGQTDQSTRLPTFSAPALINSEESRVAVGAL
jgi:hypothetical protein